MASALFDFSVAKVSRTVTVGVTRTTDSRQNQKVRKKATLPITTNQRVVWVKMFCRFCR